MARRRDSRSASPSRVTLTPLHRADTRPLFKWINDRDSVIFNAPYKPVHEPEHRGWLEAIVNRSDVVIFGIRIRSTGRLIGVCQLHSIARIHRSAELQIRIGEERYRGRGFGTEATRALVDFGFRDLNLHRIYLHVFADNARAIATYRRIGFASEGILRESAFVDGAFRDVLLMAILNQRATPLRPSMRRAS